jgi:diguanylate cyclase (GGDEF)-like protein
VGDRLIVDGIVRDVTESRRGEEALRAALAEAERANELLEAARAEADRRSRVDALTGVFNRRHFGIALAAETERARRDGHGVAIAVLDVDHFKQVNDRHGHQTGDEVLVAVARRLQDAVRPYDTVARWGGEEFVVLFPGIENETELREAAERLCNAVKATPIAAGSGTGRGDGVRRRRARRPRHVRDRHDRRRRPRALRRQARGP